MPDVVIKVENLSKEYRLGTISTGTLSRDLNRWWAKVRGKEDPHLKIGEENDRTKKGKSDYVWALKDINFEVKQGDVLGIIGRNGAGKSTLLKLLSKVTQPTTGSIKIKGRIASLLEVGTGFHPELTGKENIFLNGAILGMNKKEIKSKFDEIVDFAGVERYIDTPVKRYSSGMYVRLAFAVAAHLEPEILIVDEVLAVGDAEFQKKCLGKMQDVSHKDGRTILFVSHNMAAVKNLCNSGLLLKNGEIFSWKNNIDEIVENYFKSNRHFKNHSFIPIAERKDREGNGNIHITEFSLLNSIHDGEIELGSQIGFKIKYTSLLDYFTCKIFISINNEYEEPVLFMDSSTLKEFPVFFKKEGQIIIKLSRDFALPAGRYFCNIAVYVNDTMADYIKKGIVFTVIEGAFYSNGKIPAGKSICYVQQEWSYEGR